MTSLKSQKVAIDEAAFTKDDAFIRAMIQYDIDLALFGVSEARRNLIGKDPQAQFALSQFPDAVRLTDMARTARRKQAPVGHLALHFGVAVCACPIYWGLLD